MNKNLVVFAIECVIALIIIALLGAGCIEAMFYIGV